MAGAGAARDLALRGVSVALLEKGDFASATTARSSKLIHGGLRYLELFDFGLVRESLAERERLRRLAPHLVRPLPFLVPIYKDSSRGLVKVRIGLTLYDWLTPGRRPHRPLVRAPRGFVAVPRPARRAGAPRGGQPARGLPPRGPRLRLGRGGGGGGRGGGRGGGGAGAGVRSGRPRRLRPSEFV